MRRSLRAGAAALALLCLVLPQAGAEASVAVRLRLLGSLVREAEADWALLALGTARVSLSASSENVKAELAADALLGDGVVPSLARASVAVRFPRFRLTLGKARLAWGEGAAFNAADLLFGGSSVAGLDLAGEALRDDAAWLAALNVPLGRWSFVEAVALPPPVDVAAMVANPLAPLPDPADAAAGARLVGKLLGVKTELSYLYRGEAARHEAALSLQGNLLVDWHLSARTAIPDAGAEAADLAESLRLSAGLYHLQRLGRRARLAMRLEALVAPWGEWSEVEARAPVYGLLLYPELALSVEDAASLTLRALYSPVERSALLVPGASLSLHKGLTFLALASVSLGDATDSWSLERRGGVSVTAGCAYAY